MLLTDIVHYFTNLRKPKDEILRLQWNALKKSLDYAYNNISFYKERFDKAGIEPDGIRTRDDMLKIPVLTKTELRNAGGSLIAKGLNPNKLKRSTTSGSTGQPTNSYYTKKDWFLLKYVLKLRSKWICGLRPWHKIILVNSNPVETVQNENSKILNILTKKMSVSINQSLDQHLQLYKSFQPDVMYGTISYFNELKEHILKENIDWLKPKIIFSSGEVFDPTTKSTIEQIFNCPVYDIYGSSELKEVAWECPQRNGYHINADAYFVEFVEHDRHVNENEEGHIIITSLVNRGMPLIRYDLGDKGMYMNSRCGDGLNFPLMQPVTGRSVDYFILPSGKKVSPYTLIVALHDYASHSISQFQIIQKETGMVIIKIKPNEKFTREIEENIGQIYKRMLGEDIMIDIKIVKSIEQEKSGKYQIVKSECYQA